MTSILWILSGWSIVSFVLGFLLGPVLKQRVEEETFPVVDVKVNGGYATDLIWTNDRPGINLRKNTFCDCHRLLWDAMDIYYMPDEIDGSIGVYSVQLCPMDERWGK